MKKHLNNLGLMVVLTTLLTVPVLGYGLLMKYESSNVLSETDIRVEEEHPAQFINATRRVNFDIEEVEESTEDEFDPAGYIPASK